MLLEEISGYKSDGAELFRYLEQKALPMYPVKYNFEKDKDGNVALDENTNKPKVKDVEISPFESDKDHLRYARGDYYKHNIVRAFEKSRFYKTGASFEFLGSKVSGGLGRIKPLVKVKKISRNTLYVNQTSINNLLSFGDYIVSSSKKELAKYGEPENPRDFHIYYGKLF
jgi:hypothetical protein